MTQKSYFGTQNSILGSIFPLVMFTYIIFHIFLFRPPLYILRWHIIVVYNWWSARLIRERQSLWPFCVRASGPICPTLPPPPARHYGKQFIKKVFLFNLFGQCWPPLPPLQLHITSTNHCLYHGANIRGGICQWRQCRQQCKIFASGVKFSIFTHFLCFFLLKPLKLGEIDGINFFSWKSDGVKFLTNSMSGQHLDW